MEKNIGSEKNKVLVYGAGHQGMSMAAHLALNGVDVNLYNRTAENIKKIMESSAVGCSGVVNGNAVIGRASSDLSEVISDVVMVTVPSSAHKETARKIAPYVHEQMVIVLNPGRTFGAIDFAEELKRNGVRSLPQIAETQTIVYTCRKSGENSVNIFALKKDVKISAINGSDIQYILNAVPDCLRPYFTPVDSVALTSLSNIGMVLHCAPVMMNVGWIECEKADFKYYYDGISKSVANMMEKIDAERIAVAKAGGFEVESLKQWLERTYYVKGETLFECIQNNKAYREIDAPPSLNTRYIFEDVPNGLVPIEAMGQEYGIPTPNITTIIDLVCAVTDVDYRKTGRKFTSLQLKEYF